MSRDENFEERLSARLDAYADEQAQRAGPVDLAAIRTKRTARPAYVRVLGVAAVVALAAGLGLAAAGLMSDGRSVGLRPSPSAAVSSASASPTASPSPSAMASPTPIPSASQSAAPAPSVGPITGETPPADAQAPSGIYYLAGLEADEVWNALSSAGYACRSGVSTIPDADSSNWTIECERRAAGMEISVSSPYWSIYRVVGVFMTILPDPIDSTISDPRLVVAEANRLARLEYEGAAVGEATSWVAHSMASTDCADTPCTATFGAGQFSVQRGERGSRSLRLDGLTVVP